MEARELSGLHIGKRIRWVKEHWRPGDPGEFYHVDEWSEPITMITHKKNGQVLVRHGKRNRQPTFRADFPVEVLPDP